MILLSGRSTRHLRRAVERAPPKAEDVNPLEGGAEIPLVGLVVLEQPAAVGAESGRQLSSKVTNRTGAPLPKKTRWGNPLRVAIVDRCDLEGLGP